MGIWKEKLIPRAGSKETGFPGFQSVDRGQKVNRLIVLGESFRSDEAESRSKEAPKELLYGKPEEVEPGQSLVSAYYWLTS